MIEGQILSKFPDHVFLGEEDVPSGGVAAAAALEAKLEEAIESDTWLWIIDPVDGTTNLAYSLPLCCVSIGLVYRGEVRLGVIYDANHDEMFVATKGGGATCNDKVRRRGGEGTHAAQQGHGGEGGRIHVLSPRPLRVHDMTSIRT